jgi:glucose/arabinose dehydrogenase
VSYLVREEKRQGLSKPPIPTELETQDYKIQVEIIAKDLDSPWGIAFIDNERALITEQSGQIRVLQNNKLLTQPIQVVSGVSGRGQGGLLDIVVDPNYTENGWVYLSLTHRLGEQQTDDRTKARRAPAMTKIIRGKISGNDWIEEQVLFEAPHETYLAGGNHFGGRMVIDSDGYLFFSIGDRDSIEQAQDLSKPNGKIHRIHTDGRIPKSNPFYEQAGVLASIYTYGNRNPQGLAFHPQTGGLWSTEHGPLGGDELNLIESGKNYGWPVITHGINYNGEPISDLTHQEGMEQPIFYWRPSIATCGLDFYRGDLFPKWKNRLLVGSLKQEELQLLNIEKERVMYNETILKNVGRIREVKTGPDGAIYVLLNRPGTLLRLSPAPEQ